MSVRCWLAACAVLLLPACVMLPRTVQGYDAQCRTESRHMVLDPVQVGSIGSCSNHGCVAIVALAGVTAAASAMVSGSIVVVGNVVYWLEKQGRCTRGD